jgi:hypothetical protein
MNNLLRGIIAGIGAKKLGGGCFGSIIVFIIIWVALGQCDRTFGKDRVPDNKKNRIEQPHPDTQIKE